MVYSCVIKECKIEYGMKPVSFYGFPAKRPEILEQWTRVVQMQNGKPSWTPNVKTTKICSDHFLPSDFQERAGSVYKYQILKLNAIPSVFKSKPLLKSLSPPRKIIAENVCNITSLDISSDIPMQIDDQIKVEESQIAYDPAIQYDTIKTVDRSIQCQITQTTNRSIQCGIIRRVDRPIQCSIIQRVDRPVQCEIMTTKHYRKLILNNKRLNREIKTLKQKVKRKDLKLSNVLNIIQEINSTCFGNDNHDMDYFKGTFVLNNFFLRKTAKFTKGD